MKGISGRIDVERPGISESVRQGFVLIDETVTQFVTNEPCDGFGRFRRIDENVTFIVSGKGPKLVGLCGASEDLAGHVARPELHGEIWI